MSSDRMLHVLDKGYVRLVGHTVDFEDLKPFDDEGLLVFPRGLTLDAQIARAARVSYQEGTKSIRGDAGLIDYLVRHKHTSPLEQVSFRFQLKMPLFVTSQWIRHRTAKPNLESGRYSILRDEFYEPELDRFQAQHETNKQGSGEPLSESVQTHSRTRVERVQRIAYEEYEAMLADGVSREVARIVLPPSIYTSMVWKMDLHNLMHFLMLRMDEHAQEETRMFAQAVYHLVQPLAPLAFASFENHVLNAETFSGDEMEFVRDAFKVAFEAYDEDRGSYIEIDYLEGLLKEKGMKKSRRREFLEKLGWAA